MATNLTLRDGTRLNINTSPLGGVRIFAEEETGDAVVIRLTPEEVWALVEDLTTRVSPRRDAAGDTDGDIKPLLVDLGPITDPAIHTIGGKPINDLTNPGSYGVTHDMDCPACVAGGSSFTASPRSETYWSS